MNKVMVFIDGNDFYHGLVRNNANRDINYGTFGKELSNNRRNLIRIYYYNIEIKNNKDNESKYKEQQDFFKALKDHTFYLKLKKENSKALVDAQLIVDMVNYAKLDLYDTAILVSSNNIFVPAVEAVQDYGKHVEHAFFGNGADHLRSTSDKHILLTNQFIEECGRQINK